MLFFAFEHSDVPDHVLEPVLQGLPPLRSWNNIYHLKNYSEPESTRYYGSTDEQLMDNLRQALRQRELSFQEVPEEQLPEWYRRLLTTLRKDS